MDNQTVLEQARRKNDFMAKSLAGANPRSVELVIAALRLAEFDAEPSNANYAAALDATLTLWSNSTGTRFVTAKAMQRD